MANRVQTPLRQRAAARRSTVALKASMAASGLVMLGYLLVHMYGNLKFFQGQEHFDAYLHGLRDMFYPYLPHDGALWIIRVLLLGSILVHAYAAVTLWRRAKVSAHHSGGRRYHSKQNRRGVQRTYASFTMRWGGVVIGLFVIAHVLQMLPNYLAPGGASDSKYERVVNGFEHWWVVLPYTVALLAVGAHLHHGFWAALATLGANTGPRRRARLKILAFVMAAVITVGFLLVPFAVLFFGAGS
ncbi:MAG: succinate dehydrogenase cytochrome b subunit [Nocardioidaceae bacterium]